MDDEEVLLHWAVSALEGSSEPALPAGLARAGVRIVPAAGRCRKIVYTTKFDWLGDLAAEHLPADVMLVGRYGPAAVSDRALLLAIVSALGAPVAFVGDLDPLDLASYATLTSGAQAIPMRYFGLHDDWLARCRGDLAARREWPLERLCITMNGDERAGLERLGRVAFDWPGLIGPHSWALLTCGLKLELEGASSPGLYSDSFRNELRGRLFA